MLVVSTNEIPGYEIIEAKSIVSGTSYVGTGLWTSICIGFANFFGTESINYANKMSIAKKSAFNDMVAQANKFVGNVAIIGYSETHNGNHISCYGTVVIIAKKSDQKDVVVRTINAPSASINNDSQSVNTEQAVEEIKKTAEKPVEVENAVKISKEIKVGDNVKLVKTKDNFEIGSVGVVKKVYSYNLLVSFVDNGNEKVYLLPMDYFE